MDLTKSSVSETVGSQFTDNSVGTFNIDANENQLEGSKQNYAVVRKAFILDNQMVKVFDINMTGDDKFLNTFLFKQVAKKIKGNEYLQSSAFKKWREQRDGDFGFCAFV